MKNFLITCLFGLTVVASSFGQVAASKTLSFGTPLHTNVASGPFLLTSIQIYNSCVTPQTVSLFDAPGTNNALGIGSPGWTNTSAYVFGTNFMTTLGQSKSVTNFSGIIVTQTNNIQTIVSGFHTNVIGASNAYRLIWSGTIPASSSLVPNIGSGVTVGFGVNALVGTPMSALTNVTVNLSYTPLR
jgi:hypothetical protein